MWIVGGGCMLLFLCFGCMVISGLGVAGWQLYGEELLVSAEATEQAWNSRNGSYEATLEATSVSSDENRNNVLDVAPTATPLPPDTAVPVNTTEPEPTTVVSLDIDVPEEVNQQPIPARAFTDLQTLFSADYPTHDYFETAVRLGKEDLGDRTVPSSEKYEIGDTQSFFIDGSRKDATLLGLTEHAYFWVEEGLDLEQADVQEAADKFETEYYDNLIDLFGDVWNPGIDNDPRISILHNVEAVESELGHFSSEDEYPRALFSQSNEQEMIYLNMAELRLGSDFYYGTLVHEVQHLIQWNMDPSETVWLNEGLAQLAEIYLGYDDTADSTDYLDEPDTRLNSWNYDEDRVYRHYAAAYLFSVYLWEQLGDDAIRALSRHPANGLAGVQAILQQFAPDITLDQLLANWMVANYLDDADAGSLFSYDSLRLKRPSMKHTLDRDESLDTVNEINQFGVHYIDLNDLRGETTITFAGDTAVNLFDAMPGNGQQVWYAPAVNEMNATLTLPLDLTNADEATLRYNVWHQLEDEYDFSYVSISSDDGQSWELLFPDDATAGEFGPSYNGDSDGWAKENISLDTYVGNDVLIRWDVLTESSIAEQGFAIDDISIPELDIYYDLETGLAAWQASGFLPVGHQIPQKWVVMFIEENGPEPVVTQLVLNDLNQGKWMLEVGKGGGVLAIMPQAPYINSPANYWLKIEQE